MDIIQEVYGDFSKLGGLDGVLAFESCLEKIPKINQTFELIEMIFGDEAKVSTICMLTDCFRPKKQVQDRRLALLNEC